jgi:hypothetical protein
MDVAANGTDTTILPALTALLTEPTALEADVITLPDSDLEFTLLTTTESDTVDNGLEVLALIPETPPLSTFNFLESPSIVPP